VRAEAAPAPGALLVHYSTDFVFDGSAARPYRERDATRPLNVYGETKREGELAITESSCRHLVFRIGWVYGARGGNFLRTMLRLAAEREELRVVADQVGTPTWSRAVAEATALVVAQLRSDDADCSGIYHLGSAGQTSWHGFAEEIVAWAARHGRSVCRRVVPISTEEFAAPARRPAFSVLDSELLARTFRVRLPRWQEQLSCVLAELTEG
jgi:dTDP-4-dehydrorhamnose reductase